MNHGCQLLTFSSAGFMIYNIKKVKMKMCYQSQTLRRRACPSNWKAVLRFLLQRQEEWFMSLIITLIMYVVTIAAVAAAAYFIIKKAVKDALREQEEERR